MSNANKNRIIVGLDIGTSKVVAIVGEINPEGRLEIIGLGSHGSKGLKKGVVVNIESTVQSMSMLALLAVISAAWDRMASSRSETERCFSLTSTV
jgi:cell division ATPase FtsA